MTLAGVVPLASAPLRLSSPRYQAATLENSGTGVFR